MHRKHGASNHKKLVKAELAAWHLIAETGPIAAVGRSVRHVHAKFIGIAVLVGSLLIGLTTVGVFLTTGNEGQPASAPVPAVRHADHTGKHRLPHSEHVSKLPVTEPGSHRAKHERDYVIVRAGDSLWSIAAKYLHDPYKWSALWEKNQGTVKNPSQLVIGQRIYL